MHLGVRESVALTRTILRSLRGKEFIPEIILCPSFVAMSEVRKVLARSRVHLGAQNCGPADIGAYTGEVSLEQLEDVHVDHVLLGHSERREHFGETDALIAQKMALALSSNVQPILCIGESRETFDAGETYEYLGKQLTAVLEGKQFKRHRIVIAYEPTWAIGSGEQPDLKTIIETHAFIREFTAKLLHIELEDIFVLYGGSVDEDSAYQLLRESEIDGVLVGGASLKPARFSGIINAAVDVLTAQA